MASIDYDLHDSPFLAGKACHLPYVQTRLHTLVPHTR